MSVRSPNTTDLAILLFAALGIKRTEITTEQIALLGIYVDATMKPDRELQRAAIEALRYIEERSSVNINARDEAADGDRQRDLLHIREAAAGVLRRLPSHEDKPL